MAIFKIVINEPIAKKSFQLEIDQSKAVSLVGKKIGEEFSGDILGLFGYMLKITGGTDKDGFPMHPAVKGSVKKRILLDKPPCYHPKLKGQRKRKTVRGDTISEDITQINVKVIKKGEKPLEEIIPTKPKEKKEEKAEAKPKEEKLKEQQKEEFKKEQSKLEKEKIEAGGEKTTETKNEGNKS